MRQIVLAATFCFTACEGAAGTDGTTGPAGEPGGKGDKGDPGDPGPAFPQTPFAGSVLLTNAEQTQVNGFLGTPTRTWTLCYRMSTHGGAASIFHANCDKRGATMTIISANGMRFGGYNPKSWFAPPMAQIVAAEGAFVFSVTHSTRYQVNDAAQALIYRSDLGPQWSDLVVDLNAAGSTGLCGLPGNYVCDQRIANQDNVCSQELCGGNAFTLFPLVDVEVYYQADQS